MTPAVQKPTRPLVRYHGGKWKLAPWIISHFPKHRTYVEPFGGGGNVLLRKSRTYAEIYNDLDGEIVNLFRVARDRGAELQEALRLTPFARAEYALAWEPTECEMERARRIVMRAFMGFGSAAASKDRAALRWTPTTGFRANSHRSGTTPAHDWMNYPDAFSAIIDRLQGVVIENRDARLVMASHDDAGALHYVDPPYVAATRDAGGDYRHEMTDSDHRNLAEFLSSLKGGVIVSGYPSDLYDEIFEGWHQVERAAHADGARARTECLWMRNVVIEQRELSL